MANAKDSTTLFAAPVELAVALHPSDYANLQGAAMLRRMAPEEFAALAIHQAATRTLRDHGKSAELPSVPAPFLLAPLPVLETDAAKPAPFLRLPFKFVAVGLLALASLGGASRARADELAEPAPAVADIDAASESAPAEPRKLWLAVGIRSHHWNRKAHYNERNDGVGVEYWPNATWGFAAGTYHNSEWHQTTYAQVAWAPLRFGPLKLGGIVGVANGYPDQNHGKVFPTLMPLVAIEAGPVGLNIMVIPTIAGRVDGAVAAQLKFGVSF
jgi:hypothetical protein